MKDRIAVAIAIVAIVIALLAPRLGVQAQISQPGIPTGSILYVNSTTCPSGWAEFTAARGAYIVGRVSGGTLATVVGTALTDQENRAVGQHTHTLTVTLTDPGHHHNGHASGSPVAGHSAPSGGFTAANNDQTSGGDDFVTNSTTGIAVNTATAANSGSVTGTNAPYLQLLVCQKS